MQFNAALRVQRALALIQLLAAAPALAESLPPWPAEENTMRSEFTAITSMNLPPHGRIMQYEAIDGHLFVTVLEPLTGLDGYLHHTLTGTLELQDAAAVPLPPLGPPLPAWWPRPDRPGLHWLQAPGRDGIGTLTLFAAEDGPEDLRSSSYYFHWSPD